MEVTTQTAPIASGNSIPATRHSAGKEMAASTMVATMVTA